jgi:hypothetical protein
MVTAKDVAEWMFKKIKETDYLSQGSVVYEIQKEYGSDFVCQNENGNLAINKEVLKEFRNFIKDKFEWDRSEKAWRKINF